MVNNKITSPPYNQLNNLITNLLYLKFLKIKKKLFLK